MITWQEILIRYVGTFAMASLRYIFFAGSLYLVFYVWKRRDWFKFKIQQKFPKNKDIMREVGYSFLSLSIFVVVGSVLFVLRKNGYTRVYTNFSDYGVGYFIFSILVFIVLHDTYFYWTHRFMHWKKIYPYVHKIHHKSVNPTPWAAFAFHPLEAVVEVGILPIMLFLMPLHPFAILAFILYQSGMNVMGHLGFEMFPDGFASGKVTKWHNTSTHHNMHHKHVTCNYGLYFNFWDRVMGTNHERYETEFDYVRERAKEQAQQEENGQTEGLVESLVK
jgi:sterol desaturase/sphingolipid hydroxylase (fatty acid hydroxylase superfamily)